MASGVGYGMAGRVCVGIALMLIRKRILTIIDKVWSRFISSAHTPEEADY